MIHYISETNDVSLLMIHYTSETNDFHINDSLHIRNQWLYLWIIHYTSETSDFPY